jgi:translocation and assembly module TamB
MRRALSITGWVVLGFLLTLIVTLVLLTQTTLGTKLVDRFGKPVIQDIVEQQLGSTIDWDVLTGKLGSTLVIRDLELSQDGEVWAEAEHLTLEWKALDLLSGEIDITQIVLADGAFYRVPDIPEKEEQPQEESGLPNLPDIRLDNLTISDFVLSEEVVGDRYTLSLQGSGVYLDPRLTVNLQARTAERTDEVLVDLRFNDGVVDVDLSVLSDEGGVLSGLISAEGSTEMRARAQGPLENLEARLAARAGHYGEVTGTIGGSIDETDRVTVDLSYLPGPFLPEDAQAALGEEVILRANLQRDGDGGKALIDELTGAFGSIAGAVEASWGETLSAEAELAGRIEGAALEPYGAESFSGAFGLTAEGRETENGYAFSGELSAGTLKAAVADGQSTDEVPFSGEVDLALKGYELGDERIDLLLAEGVTLSADARYSTDGRVRASDLDATLGTTTGRRLRLTGEVAAGLEDEDLNASVRMVAGPQLVGLFAEGLELGGAVTLVADAEGSFDSFSAEGQADLPSGSIDGQAFPAGRLVADLSGLPAKPSGSVRLVSQDGSYDGQAAFVWENDTIRVPRLDLEAGGLSVEGSGRYDTAARAGQAQLRLDAEDGTTLITGQTLGGSLSIDAEVEPDLGPVNLSLTSEGLSFEGQTIGSLKLNAQGPREAISYDLTGRDISAGDLFFKELRSTGAIDLAETPEAAIDSLVLSLPGDEDDVVRLREPTRISWSDGIELAPTEIEYLGDGVLTAEASFANDRWQADLSGRDIPLPKAEGLGDFDLTIDTERAEVGRLDLTIESAVEDQNYSIDTDAVWDGQTVRSESRVVRGDGEELGTVNASIPATLTRSEGLSIDFPEEGLDVQLDYSDRIGPLYAFLPIDGQPVTGVLDAQISITGSTRAPITEGTIRLTDGRFEERDIGITLTELNGAITFDAGPDGTRGEVNITGSGASGRDEAVRLYGTLATTGDQSSIDLNLDLDRAQLARGAELELRVTSELDLQGSFEEVTLSGPIRLDELDIAIPDTGGGSDAPSYAPVNVVRVDGPARERAGEVDAPDESPITVNLDLSVRAGNGIFIRGRGLTSEWNADLRVTGTTDDPRIAGTIGLEQGELNLAGRSFELTEGQIGFQRSSGLNPVIDLQAQTTVGSGADEVTAIINVEGEADDPNISFGSNPALPEEDVLAIILFGRPATDLGAAEALQLAQAAATVTGTAGFGGAGGIGGSLRSGLGLDRLSIDPSTRSVTVGKYISEDVYVSARPSIGDTGTVISVVYEISRFFNLETILSPDRQTLGANYKRDY